MENDNSNSFNTQFENINKVLKMYSDSIQDSMLPYSKFQKEIYKTMESFNMCLRNISESITDSLSPFYKTLEEFSKRQAEILDKFRALDILQSPLTSKQSKDLEHIYSSIIYNAIEDDLINEDIATTINDKIKSITIDDALNIIFFIITTIFTLYTIASSHKSDVETAEFRNEVLEILNNQTQILQQHDNPILQQNEIILKNNENINKFMDNLDSLNLPVDDGNIEH